MLGRWHTVTDIGVGNSKRVVARERSPTSQGGQQGVFPAPVLCFAVFGSGLRRGGSLTRDRQQAQQRKRSRLGRPTKSACSERHTPSSCPRRRHAHAPGRRPCLTWLAIRRASRWREQDWVFRVEEIVAETMQGTGCPRRGKNGRDTEGARVAKRNERMTRGRKVRGSSWQDQSIHIAGATWSRDGGHLYTNQT